MPKLDENYFILLRVFFLHLWHLRTPVFHCMLVVLEHHTFFYTLYIIFYTPSHGPRQWDAGRTRNVEIVESLLIVGQLGSNT